jgi:hypothetical protein
MTTPFDLFYCYNRPCERIYMLRWVLFGGVKMERETTVTNGNEADLSKGSIWLLSSVSLPTVANALGS